MRKVRILTLVLVASTVAGYGGYLMGRQQLRLEFKNYRPAIVVNQSPAGTGKLAEVNFALFWTVWDKLAAEYVDKSAIDAAKMVEGAISGMVNSLGDPYTVYLPKKQNEEAKQDLNGAFEGVGIQLGFKDNRLAVMSPLDGTPAAGAGVRAGDLILAIKDEQKKVDQNTDGMTIPEAVSLIRGPKGTVVILTLAREGVTKPWEVTLVRDTIVVKSATMEIRDKCKMQSVKCKDGEEQKFTWLKLNRFGDRTQEEWSEAVNQFTSLPVNQLRGIVLDLRNNPGGYLDGAVWVAGEFLPAGKLVVAQQYGDGTRVNLKVERNGRLLKPKLVVLVNQGSASAAEILAGALQDHKRATIVGEKTFGKGSVQQPDDFPDGSGIHITIARWLRPKGDWIDKKGIVPDVEVKAETASDSTQLNEVDVQLQKAVELLN